MGCGVGVRTGSGVWCGGEEDLDWAGSDHDGCCQSWRWRHEMDILSLY